jgi:mannose-1-phosphate guanylyltransferase
MLPVLNQPFLEHMIRNLRENGVDDIILSLCYLPDRIESYFGDGSRFDVKLTYVVEESPLGTAGGVKNTEGYLDDLFFVFNGDIFTDIDLRAMLSLHRQRKARASIALTPVEDTSRYGVVETDAQGMVKRFVEKPPREEATTNMINAGIYILDAEVLKYIPSNTHFMFEHHLFPLLLEKGMPISGYPSDAYWIDMGTPEKYQQLQFDMLERRCVSFPYSEDMKYGAESNIHPTVQIEGAVVIGSRCVVSSGVRIKGPAVIGPGCKVLDGATIERSILWRNVRMGRRAVLKDCVVGDGCFIGDDSYVPAGAVLADNVEVTGGSELQPGAAIWPDTRVG